MADAYTLCNYPFLAVAPAVEGDSAGLERAKLFKEYVEGRFPQLLDPNMTHFPRADYEFVRVFDSSNDIDNYVTSSDYGTSGKEEIALAVIFDGGDPLDFKYSLRINSTNFNTPELSARPGAMTTPDTKKQFATYARADNQCTAGDSPEEGKFVNSCTGRYIYNGFLTTQRLVHDFIMIASGAKEAGYHVAEHGVRCKIPICDVHGCGK